VLCSNCRTTLPDNAHFCLKCGHAVNVPESKPEPPPVAPPPSCTKCQTELPAGSKFCLKCGQPVPLSPEISAGPSIFCDCGTKLPAGSFFCPMCGKAVNVGPNHPLSPKLRRRKHPARFAIWLLVPALLAAGAWWAATSDNENAQQFRKFITMAHSETIASPVFSVKARGYSSYKFMVPFGTANAAVSGEFTATGDSSSEIEVYVFKDDGFVNWQYGYSPSSYYSSGRVRQADIKATLPGPGTYYVVFNNNFSPRTTKSVQADVTLNYSKLWPHL